MTTYIIGAGCFYGLDESPNAEDLVIAADGGLAHLNALNITPDLVIGDMDSLGYMPQHPHVIKLPVEKDVTDTEAALHEGLNRGYTQFHLYGCTGGRPDHTLSNIQMLHFLSLQGAQGYLHDETTIMTVIHNDSFSLPSGGFGHLSILSLEPESRGVTLSGLEYSLENACITHHQSLGISNELTGLPCQITVEEGTLLIIWPRTIPRKKTAN